jgi:hypothetical protein
MGFAGSNPLRFLQQLDDYGLKGKIGVLGNTTSTDEGILKLMGLSCLVISGRAISAERRSSTSQSKERTNRDRLRGWAWRTRSAPGDRQGVGGASPLR